MAGVHSKWRGIVWVVQLEDATTDRQLEHLDGHWRRWGNVVLRGMKR